MSDSINPDNNPSDPLDEYLRKESSDIESRSLSDLGIQGSVEPDLTEIAEHIIANGLLDELAKNERQRKLKDPEWTNKRYYHLSTLLKSFICGVVTADPWYNGYCLPPDFESVVNWISICLQKQFNDEVAQTSLIEMEDAFMKWGMQHPSFVKWNESPSGGICAIICSDSKTPDHRDFISLDVIVKNACIHLRDETRKNDEFDRQFEKKYGKPKG